MTYYVERLTTGGTVANAVAVVALVVTAAAAFLTKADAGAMFACYIIVNMLVTAYTTQNSSIVDSLGEVDY